MNLDMLALVLERARSRKVAVIGDLLLDRFIYGNVVRVSPEAPVPVLVRESSVSMPGGAGNVVRNLSSLEAKIRFVASVGRDGSGRELEGLLNSQPGTEARLLQTVSGRTTVKTRYIAGGQQLLRLDEEHAAEPEGDFLEAALWAISWADVVLISDYAKGTVTTELMGVAIRAGRAVIVDPKGNDFARYGPVNLIKPNASELAAATGHAVDSDSAVEIACEWGLSRWEAKAILVTRGAQGATLVERGCNARHFRAGVRRVFDVSGAGDTCLVAIGLALASGMDLADASEFAMLASGIAVSKPGTAVVTPAELIGAELSAHAAPAEAKVVTPDQAAAAAARWRAEGLRVGFTNGCFDVLHRGHVAYLAQARGWCDRLVVGLNSDASVRALKGEGRPVNDLEGRALVLAHLASVDLVVPFNAPTPLALIEAVRPDVLVKGADYTREGVVGGDLVEGWGGEVKLAELVDGHSTTATIARMQEGLRA